VVLRSHITDNRGFTYTVFEATEPAEVGQLYRLFLQTAYPKTISQDDRFLLATDSSERIIGGVCFQIQPEGVVYMDGIVVSMSLRGRGIATALIQDLIARLAEQDCHLVKVPFSLRRFFRKRGFQPDHRWGGLVRYL
jgi:N-acetylglutamate synthase-like GNAT family acetyltransferase